MDTQGEQQLKFGYWFVTHKLQLRRVLVVFLFVVDAFLLAVSLFYAVLFYQQRQTQAQLLSSLTQRQLPAVSLDKHLAPQALQFAQPVLLANATNQTVDVAVEVTNPNADWAVTLVHYHFSAWPDEILTGFFLPGQRKFFSKLQAPAGTTAVTLVVNDITWRRLSNDFKVPAVNFVFTNPQTDTTRNQGVQLTRVTADMYNSSVYDFWSVPVTVLLYRQGQLVGINRVTYDQVKSLSTQKLAATWFGPSLLATQYEFISEVNVFDSTVYWQVDSGPGEAP